MWSSYRNGEYYLQVGGMIPRIEISFMTVNGEKKLEFSKTEENIDLSGMKIQEISLPQFNDFTHLSELNLEHNSIKSCDLGALLNVKPKRIFNIADNPIKKLNITQLLFLRNTRQIILPSCRFLMDPLCKYIEPKQMMADYIESAHLFENYAEMSKFEVWKSIVYRTKRLNKHIRKQDRFRVQKGFLKGFDLSEFSGYDGNLYHLFRLLSQEDEYQTAREKLLNKLKTLLAR